VAGQSAWPAEEVFGPTGVDIPEDEAESAAEAEAAADPDAEAEGTAPFADAAGPGVCTGAGVRGAVDVAGTE
jgi:hypothetical protein